MSKAKAMSSFLRQAPLIVLVASVIGYSRLASASPTNKSILGLAKGFKLLAVGDK